MIYIDILANKNVLPQVRDVRYCICPPTSAIIIFCEAHGMSCATRTSNSNFRNNSCVLKVNNEISPILVTHLLVKE